MVSNVEKLEFKGMQGTSFTVNPDQLQKGSVVFLNNNSSNGPVITTLDDMEKAIPDRGPLVRPCGHCRRSPARGETFARCAKCKTTHYCSRECQTANWAEHKPICKQRTQVLAEMEKQKAQALAEGKKFYDPVTVQTWYRENNNTIEYAAFHVLELWKGRASSKQPTHFVLISVEVDENQPEDPKLVRYKDAGPVPYDKLEQVGAVSALLKKAISEGYMVLFFVDVKHNIRLLEFHEPPPSEPYLKGEKKPDDMWQVNTVVKLNGRLPSLD